MADGSSLIDDLKAQAPDRFLASFYTSTRNRPGLVALFALDLQLGDIVRATREPMIGQIKLAWWRERLETLGHSPVPAHPLLRGVSDHLLPRAIDGPLLSQMEQGWVALLAEPLSADALEIHAGQRGAVLFGAIVRLLGSDTKDARRAGEGWALADVGAKLSDPITSKAAWRLARERLNGVNIRALPAALRGLALLAKREAGLGQRLPDGQRLLLQARGSLLGF